jgi:F-type H+-transporting ATPase subunit gamma
MQSAEKNIEERLEELFGQFHRQRQSTITEELLDIVCGSEALGGTKQAGAKAESGRQKATG